MQKELHNSNSNELDAQNMQICEQLFLDIHGLLRESPKLPEANELSLKPARNTHIQEMMNPHIERYDGKNIKNSLKQHVSNKTLFERSFLKVEPKLDCTITGLNTCNGSRFLDQEVVTETSLQRPKQTRLVTESLDDRGSVDMNQIYADEPIVQEEGFYMQKKLPGKSCYFGQTYPNQFDIMVPAIREHLNLSKHESQINTRESLRNQKLVPGGVRTY